MTKTHSWEKSIKWTQKYKNEKKKQKQNKIQRRKRERKREEKTKSKSIDHSRVELEGGRATGRKDWL